MKGKAFIAILLALATLTGCSDGNVSSNIPSQPDFSTTTDTAATETVPAENTEPFEETTTVPSDTTPPPAAEETTAETEATETTPVETDTIWTESPVQDTVMYVNTECYSRKDAFIGAEAVELYYINDEVNVVATTDTDYYKLDNGAFIHMDYLSESKMEITTTTTAATPAQPTGEGIEVINGITYVQGIMIANKTYALPSDYNPGVSSEAYNALIEMEYAAANEGITLFLNSGFRSYSDQYVIYNRYVSWDGKAEADRYSARPGHSEHQTGYAFDLNSFEESFGETPEGIWLAENCHKYGFIIRYPKGKEHITGYMYEPWHVRYLGVDIATSVYECGLTLEEYLGITSVYAD